MAQAFGVQDKADGIRAGGHGGVYVLFAREAADFDAGSGVGLGHGSQSKVAVRSGKPHSGA